MSWKSTLENVISDRRRAMGKPPSQDELIDLREGRLTTDERERVLERVAVDPAVARDLLDVVDYPALPLADDEPDSEQRAEHWRQFQELLQAEKPAGQDPAMTNQISSPRPQGYPAVSRTPRWWGLAATFLVGTLAGAFGWHTLREPAPGSTVGAGNVEILSLSVDQGPGSRGGRVEMSETAEWTLLTFGSARLQPAPDYAIVVHDAAGGEVWRHVGLVTGTGGLLTALIPAEVLPPGGYQVEIYPHGELEGQPTGTASFVVEAKSP